MLLTLSMLFIIFASILLISFSTQASDMEHHASYKYFTSIKIEKGDTLWSIANENMDYDHYKNVSEYVNEVKTMNSLTSDRIVAGSYLIIPYYSTEYVYSNETPLQANAFPSK